MHSEKQYVAVKEELDEIKQLIRLGAVKRKTLLMNIKHYIGVALLVGPSAGMGILAMMPIALLSIFMGFACGVLVVYGILILQGTREQSEMHIQETAPQINVMEEVQMMPALINITPSITPG
jgi:hypothetical protein